MRKTVKAACHTAGHTTRVQNLASFGDGTIDTNNIGYSIGTGKGKGNQNVGPDNNGYVSVWQDVLENPPSVAIGNNNEDYRAYRHTSSQVCSYVYRLNSETNNRNNSTLVIKYDSRDGSVITCGTHPDLPAC